MNPAILARLERIEPQANGGGKLRRRGVVHIFNGDQYRKHSGVIRAWCGAKVSTVDLCVIEDRNGGGGLWADICRRCFMEPRAKVIDSHELPIRERPCATCGTPYKTMLPDSVFAKSPEKDLCSPCTQNRIRTTRKPHG